MFYHCVLPLPHFKNASISQKITFIPVQFPSFWSCYPEDTSSSPSPGGQQVSIPESHGIVTNGGLVPAWLTYPTHHAESGLKYMPSVFVEEVYLLVLQFQPQWQVFRLAQILRPRESLMDDISQEGACTSGSIFIISTKKVPLESLALVPAIQYTFVFIKSFCLKIWLLTA